MDTSKIELGPDHHGLTPESIELVATNPKVKVFLSKKAQENILKSRAIVEKMVEDNRVVYGVTTGFGNFKNKVIDHDHTIELQQNLIRSHAAGVGPFLLPEMVRAGMLVRLNSLSKGYSGVRPILLQLLQDMINKNVVPQVPSQGSVGASGDLAPLSHIGLVLMGEGKAYFKGELMSGSKALKKAGLKPIKFMQKEGLAFNNGTSIMAGIASITLARAKRMQNLADLACAMTLEAVCGVTSAFQEKVHLIRPHPGQILSAKNILRFVNKSKLTNSIPNRIQDSYSLRCAPQVHGACRGAIKYVDDVINCEINSVTDNPLIFSGPDEAISAGNFHGEHIAIAMDTLGIAIAEFGSISERRTAKLVDPSTNEGLPAFLIPQNKGGLHNGLMIPQYTAAALVSENKVLAHPASVDSIPTSANQEDHVSMGSIATRKAYEILKNVENVLAIEYMTAAQAIDFRGSSKLGKFTKLAWKKIREIVPKVEADREMAKDMNLIRELILSDHFVEL